MDLPEEIELEIITWVGHNSKTTNYYNLRQVCSRWKIMIESNILLEVDHDKYITIPVFNDQRQIMYIDLLQKRNNAVTWDDHRGFLVITDCDAYEWHYYERLRQYLFLERRFGKYLIYPGKMIFYDL
jgi:hypothetical protein